MRLTLRERITGEVEDRKLDAPDIGPGLLPYSTAGDVTPTNATAIGDAYACIRVLADAAASVPLIAYRRTPNGRERVEGGRLPELLQRPAPGMTQSAFIGQLMTSLQTYGNAFIGKYKRGGVVDQLGLLPADRVTVELRAGEPVYRYSSTRGLQDLTTRDVVHVRSHVSSDGLTGLSPVRQARTVLAVDDHLAKHASQYFRNGAMPAGVLNVSEGASSASMEALKETWRSRHEGVDQAHQIAIVSGVEFTPISFPLDDLQFLEQRKLSATEVARIFRVPGHMINAHQGESLTYSNTESRALEFVAHSLRPWLVAIEQAFTADPDLCFERQYVEFLIDALLRADSKTRADVYTKALDPITGWLNRNEVRRLENLEPDPDRPQPLSAAPSNGTGDPQNVSQPEGATNE